MASGINNSYLFLSFVHPFHVHCLPFHFHPIPSLSLDPNPLIFVFLPFLQQLCITASRYSVWWQRACFPFRFECWRFVCWKHISEDAKEHTQTLNASSLRYSIDCPCSEIFLVRRHITIVGATPKFFGWDKSTAHAIDYVFFNTIKQNNNHVRNIKQLVMIYWCRTKFDRLVVLISKSTKDRYLLFN